jgi:predicted dehydrogenase
MAELAGRILMVGHVFLYNPGIQRLKEFIHAGPDGIGQVYYCYATRTNLGPIRQDVNVVWDLAPHDISIFNDLLGAVPLWVNAVGGRVLGSGREDVVFITLAYPGGILAHIHVGWADPSRVRQVVVVGNRKRIVFDDVNIQEKLRIYEKGVTVSGTDSDDFGQFMLAIRDGDIISPRLETLEPLKELCTDFLACVVKRTRPRTDAEQGLAVVNVLIAIQQSIALEGARVRVSASERATA